LTIWAWLF
jgi:hypothetical protein